MFEKLFTYPAVIRRHREAPFAEARARYLSELEVQSYTKSTLLRYAEVCLCVAVVLDQWPEDQSFTVREVKQMLNQYAAANRTPTPSSEHHSEQLFQTTATGLLRVLGRLRSEETTLPHRYRTLWSEFINLKRQQRWRSEHTCRSGHYHITQLLIHLEQRSLLLKDIAAVDLDAYFQCKALQWNRSTLRTSASFVRSWLRYCEQHGYVRPGLVDSNVLPRVYHDEQLPLGPTWETISGMLEATGGNNCTSIRNHALILLLAVYGLRSGEVRRLTLDDLDWEHNRIRVVRSKSGRCETLPLIPQVGNAIARYLREARPETPSRNVFVGLQAPYRPLSRSGLYCVVKCYLPADQEPEKGRGPHGLRHACARHLLELGLSFKQVGDHLGHRHPDSTRIYAKVNLSMLRKVAFEDLGRLL